MRRATIRFVAVQLALAAALAAGLWLSYPGWRLGRITERIRGEYRDLQFITTGDLANWLAPPNAGDPVMLDVRTPAEFEASHLLEAHRVTPAPDLDPAELPPDRGQAIVVYCSTGERSAAFARRLQRAGYGSVFVLEGAIVRWANEERPLTNGRHMVTRVHPGDPQTALLLKGAHRAALPGTP